MRTAHCVACGFEAKTQDLLISHCPQCKSQMHFVISLDPVGDETSHVRVLIVDDDDQVRDVVRSYLDAQGFESVRTAPSGPDAAVIAEEFRPEVVLLDYLMPAMKGDDTAKLLRKIVPDAAVIAFSAVINERPPWADAFLPKSRLSDAAQLIEVLRPVSVEAPVSPRPGVKSPRA